MSNFLTKYLYNFHFKHLTVVKQNYKDHMKDSFYYGIVCFKLAVCFFIHGLYPDLFEHTSVELSQLLTLIKMKYNKNVNGNGNGNVNKNEPEILPVKPNSLLFYFNPSTEELKEPKNLKIEQLN